MFKDKIKALRENKGLTKKQVADAIGITERRYIAYEYGQNEPNIEIITKIAKFYNVSADYLLGIEQEEPPNPLDMLNLSPLEKAMFQMYINVSPKTRREMEEIARKAAAGVDFQPIIDMLLAEQPPEKAEDKQGEKPEQSKEIIQTTTIGAMQDMRAKRKQESDDSAEESNGKYA